MAIQGLRHLDTLAADERPKNWREGILLLFPNGKAPFFALTSQMKSKSTDDPEYNWWEKEVSAQRLALNEDLDNSETTITVVSGALECKEGDLLYVEGNGEILYMTQDPTIDTEIEVIRGFAGTTGTAQTYAGAGDNPNLLKIGSAYEENSSNPTPVGYNPTKKYNYTQIFRDNLAASRTAQKTRLRTRNAVKEAKRETIHYHAAGIERAFIFGGRDEDTRNGTPIRTTDGIMSVLAREAGWNGVAGSNISDLAGAATDMDTLETHLDRMFRFGSSEKLAFSGNTALLTLNKIARKNSSYQMMQGQKEYGMSVSRFICPFGELVVKTHPLFNQVLGGTTGGSAYYGMDSWLLVMDMDNLVYRYLDDTFYKAEQQSNGVDGMESGFITEAGLEIMHAKTHYCLKGLAAAAIDS